MFSVDYRNESIVVTTSNNRRINFQNIEKLRKLIFHLLKNPCNKIILDLQGVKFIDSASFAQIDELIQIVERHNIIFTFANIDAEVKELFDLLPATANYKIDELAITNETCEIAVLA